MSCDLAPLLGRDRYEFGPAGDYLAGRRVLVTGAGGTIGRALCQLIAEHGPEELILLGHGETPLYGTAYTLACPHTIALADLRDLGRLRDVFAACLPEIVFHTAALKHQPLLERQPVEALKTNVWGTDTLLVVAADCAVERLVNVSTDKAADPQCAYGASKRIGERLTANRLWPSVRLGNVLGSSGSVLGLFARQLADGGPVTVTAHDVDRYFMTAAEAAQVLVTVGELSGNDLGAHVVVPDLGEPVRIVDLVQRMAALAGVDGPPIVYTGLRPGEKLHETLVGEHEKPMPTAHPRLAAIDVPAMDELNVGPIPVGNPPDKIRAALLAAAMRQCGG